MLNVSGLRCVDGGLEQIFATSSDGEVFEGGTQPFTLQASELLPGTAETGTLSADEAQTLATFDCAGLTLP